MNGMNEILELDKLNKKQFKEPKDYYDFLMYQIQAHLVEIDDLKISKDPHVVKEVADIALLAYMLAVHEGASAEDFRERIEKIKSKILEKLQ